MKTFDESANAKARELAKTVIRKQKDYGKGNILKAPINPLLAVIVRLNDKVQRFANLVENDKNPQNESLQDTALDIMGYGMILSMVLDDTFELPLENLEKVLTEVSNKKKRATTVAEKELLINRLHDLWIANPDLRLSQLILNVFTKDFYYVEDEAFIDDLEGFYETK